jgi:hypothetical protein
MHEGFVLERRMWEDMDKDGKLVKKLVNKSVMEKKPEVGWEAWDKDIGNADN